MVEEQSADGAFAEIEVIAIGDNIAIGTDQRGFFTDGAPRHGHRQPVSTLISTPTTPFPQALANWVGRTTACGLESIWARCFSSMRCSSIRCASRRVLWALASAAPVPVTPILFSDGTRRPRQRSAGGGALRLRRTAHSPQSRRPIACSISAISSDRAKWRYLFWHGVTDSGWGQAKWGEFMVFSPGYPAEVVLRSDFIDLGAADGRPKVINALSWDAETARGHPHPIALALGQRAQRAIHLLRQEGGRGHRGEIQ